MELPERMLYVLDEIVDDLVHDRYPPDKLINEAVVLILENRPDESRIFVRHEYSDFERLLFALKYIEELKKIQSEHDIEIGKLQSIIDEQKHTIGKLMNYDSGERAEYLKDKILSKLQGQLKESNSRIEAQQKLIIGLNTALSKAHRELDNLSSVK